MSTPDLEGLYKEARDAVSSRDYERASSLLKRILVIDEDYEDASRLLAQIVLQQRARWYNDPRRWGIIAALLLVIMGIYFVPKLRNLVANPSPTSIITPQATSRDLAAAISPPSTSQAATATVTAPTPIPLRWGRICPGQEFARDFTTVIVSDPSDPDVLYAGTANAGIYKSIDGGLSWQPMHNGLGQASVRALLIDPQNPRTLYAAIPMVGVYKTTDGGENWTASNQGIASHGSFNSLVMDPQDPQRLLYADGEGRLSRSNDAGVRWSSIGSFNCPDHMDVLVAHPTLDGTLFSSNAWSSDDCPAGIYQSDDGGSTWSIAASDLLEVQDLAIDAEEGSLLFAAGANSFRSADGGESWTLLPVACSRIEINPQNPSEVYCAVWGAEQPSDPGSILKSADGGRTWQTVLQLEIGRTLAIAFSPHDSGIVFLGGGGFHVSTDAGQTWVEHNDGLGANRLNLQIDLQDNPTHYAEDSNCRLYRSSDQGNHWEPISDQGCGLAIDADGSTIYRASADLLLRSQDRGTTWEVLALPRILGPYVHVVAHPRQPGMLYALYWQGTAYISPDRGETWQATDIELGDVRLFFDHDQGQTSYAVGRADPAYRSADSGQTWQRCGAIGSSMGPSEGMVGRSVLMIDPRDSDHIFLATRGSGVLRSTDGCRNWSSSTEGLGNLFVNVIAFDPLNPDMIYVGTDGGAYVSFDGAERWAEINDGLLGATIVYSIVVDPVDPSRVYAATPYGIFKLESR